jgi:type I restriction enzyme S subunit
VLSEIKIDAKFLYYHMMYKWRSSTEKLNYGSTIKYVRITNFTSYEIEVPDKTTQHQIVSRIESLFAELDKAVEHLRNAQQQLKTYRQAVLNHWLNNEDGKWEMVPIKEIISVISNGSTPKADKMFSKGEIQFIKVYNLNFDGSINLSKEPVFIDRETHETLLKRSQTKQGDVLINIVGPPLGKVSIVPNGDKEYNINQAIVMFRPNEFVISKFLAYYLMSPQVIEWLNSTSKATAGQYNVKVSTCREIMFPKISLSEQQRIVEEIESRLSQAEVAEARIAEALQKTEALRQSILKKAFSGELVVSTSSTTSKGG